MEEHRIMADPLKFIAALFSCVVLGFLAWRSFQLGYVLLGIVFALIAAVFIYIMVLYGSVLHISAEGIRREFFIIPMKAYTWDQVREIGVVGTKVFNGTAKNRKTGRRYIYISPEEMDEGSRFKMTLEWPPRNGILYCIYSREHIDALQYFWSRPIVKYNAGDIFVNSAE